MIKLSDFVSLVRVTKTIDETVTNPPPLAGANLERLRMQAETSLTSAKEKTKAIEAEIDRLTIERANTIRAGAAMEAALKVLDNGQGNTAPYLQQIGRATRPPQAPAQFPPLTPLFKSATEAETKA